MSVLRKEKGFYRSIFEATVCARLDEDKVKFEYETTVIPYIKPETNHTYTIDFTLPNGILVETKGRWVLEDRKKHILIQKQHPELDIRMVFQNSKGSSIMEKEEKSKEIKLFFAGICIGTLLVDCSQDNIYLSFIIFFLITIGWGIYYYREED